MDDFNKRLLYVKQKARALPKFDSRFLKDSFTVRIISDLIAPIFLCVMIGYWIGCYAGNIPIWIIVCFSFGSAVGLYNVYKLTMRR